MEEERQNKLYASNNCQLLCQSSQVCPESEQGASTKGHCSPASLEFTMALEWNPEFTLKTEPGYEQCGTITENTSGSEHLTVSN